MKLQTELFYPKTIPNSIYKKRFGAWGEEQVDAWMDKQNWFIHKKNLKIRGGEIDRVYRFHHPQNSTIHTCVAEIKTIFCKNSEHFCSIFKDSGLSALIKNNQIANLYKYADYLNARSAKSNTAKKIYVRFFIVLKLYTGYEKESFFKLQKIYKICTQTEKTLILSFTPEFTVANRGHTR